MDVRRRRVFSCRGKILQRFPEKDWPDCGFTEGVELFCQPRGWRLSSLKEDPTFVVSVFTDVEGRRRFCGCLTFYEAVVWRKDGEDREESEVVFPSNSSSFVPGISVPALPADTLKFAPKCLVLISPHEYPDVFRNILGLIYTVHNECLTSPGGERIKIESLLGNLLGSVYVPHNHNQHQVRFSLSGLDKMSLQPPLYPEIPLTSNKVALLFKQLGIRSTLTLFCSAVTELKILFLSNSFSRLTDSCLALISLLYPLKYSHVFIPILPSALIEVLSTPTPFIIGLHASHRHEVLSDLLDVVVVDLDGGSVSIPENIHLQDIYEPLLSKVRHELSSVLNPDLGLADRAFVINGNTKHKHKPDTTLDKELRSVMLRLLVQLFAGYRSCLTLVRIHPKPYITFHKAAFLGMRNQTDSVFMKRIEFENHSNSITNSVAESDSIDAESGFEDQEISDIGQNVIKFVTRFADKVCSESNVTEEHIRAVNQMIPGTVAMHIETLENVATQAKHLPPIQKTEKYISQVFSLGRSYLLKMDFECIFCQMGEIDLTMISRFSQLEGPFLNQISYEYYERKKRFSFNEYLGEVDQQLKEGIQIKSNTFQIIRAGFDDEVTTEEVESFRHIQGASVMLCLEDGLLLRGRVGSERSSSTSFQSGVHGASNSNGLPHRFEKHHYSTPTSCDWCNSLLWGLVRTGYRCSDCGYNCHEKCKDLVLKTCNKGSGSSSRVPRDITSDNFDQLLSGYGSAETSTSGKDMTAISSNIFNDQCGEEEPPRFSVFDSSSNADEHNSQIICQGYLYKQANFRIKGWKQRWFVLDSTKHQLRYYDTKDDFHSKGYIDLSEVKEVNEGSPQQNAPKKCVHKNKKSMTDENK
ncbi:SBF1_2 [Lepeophtheirus salmonis]|uniref:SBF1_2 n=1 Tax=Lepeophtheirus salmonis TaxID=72036 RepID=A0A7R8H9A0_LEPSM|nr:SBF1_2 [Lepeophtheirus salmonis]CAF2951529.1 SBF1_2 [Lepeophtheirus salmonis]